MVKRIITAAVALPLFLFVLFFLPVTYSAILASLLSAIAAYELLHPTGIISQKFVLVLTILTAGTLPHAIYWGIRYEIILLFYFLYIVVLFLFAMGNLKAFRFSHITKSLFAALVLPMFFSAFPVILSAEKGKYLIILPFLFAWGSDTCAYFVGVAMGKHKLAPHVSPKKSVEGAVGGLIGTLLLTVLYCVILKNAFHLNPNFLLLMALAVFCSIISMIGDLSLSLIKRENHLKDYGNLMPGHGGVLDRFDSVLFVLPVVYAAVSLFSLV